MYKGYIEFKCYVKIWLVVELDGFGFWVNFVIVI